MRWFRMHGWRSFSRSLLVVVTLLFGVERASAAEEVERFVEALKKIGYHDAALDYLTMLETSPLLTDEQKKALPMMQGSILIDQSRSEKNPDQKNKQLDLASEKLNAFVKNNTGPLVAAATMELGHILVERAHYTLGSAYLPANLANKEALIKEARGLFEQSKKIFEEAAEKFNTEWRAFPAHIDENKDPAQYKAREEAQRSTIKAKLNVAAIYEELAKTYPKGSAEYKKLYQEAADMYEQIYVAFRSKKAGLVARLTEGRCYLELGDTKRALGLINDMLIMPADPAINDLKTSALFLAMQCWNLSVDQLELSIQQGEAWLQHAVGAEDQQGDWLAVRYHLAEAYMLSAEKRFKDDQAKREQALKKAREHLTFIAKLAGNPYEGAAIAMLEKVSGGTQNTDGPPKDFAEAVRRAKDFNRQMQDHLEKAETAATPADKDAEKALATSVSKQAREMYRTALDMRPDTTDPDVQEEVNNVRYSLANLEYFSGNFYEAAVLGEFLARNYFTAAGAQNGALIALSSYGQSMADPTMPAEFAGTDRAHLVSLAEYMVGRWKDDKTSDVAEKALNALAVIYGSEMDLAKAMDCLEQMKENSPLRAEAEMKVGQFCYKAYVVALGKDEKERPPQAEIDKHLADAKRLLESGLAGMKASVDSGATVTPDVARAVLMTTDIYNRANESQKAVELLEDDKIGPITLVEDGHPVAKAIPDMPLQAYQLYLQALIGNKDSDKAQAALEKLRTMTGDNAEGQKRLANLLVTIGKTLEEQLKTLMDSGKADEAKKVSKVFELFLDQISKSSGGTTFPSLNWVSTMYFGLGEGNRAGKVLAPDVKAFYEKSLAVDKAILERAAKEQGFLPSPDSALAVRLRDAKTYRRMKEYSKALDEFEAILIEKPILEAQKEAADTYMDWAADDPRYFKPALNGARKDAKGAFTIWGWNKISSWAQNIGNDAEFLNARYQICLCYFQKAENSATPQAEKQQLLQSAVQDMRITNQIKPNFGNDTQKFDTLLKSIQKLQGEPPIGLKAFAPPPQAAAAGS